MARALLPKVSQQIHSSLTSLAWTVPETWLFCREAAPTGRSLLTAHFVRKDESKEPQDSTESKEVTPPSKKSKTGNDQSSQSAQAGQETESKSTKSKKTEKEKSEHAEARDTWCWIVNDMISQWLGIEYF